MGWKLAISAILIGVLIAYMSGVFSPSPGPPEVGDGWWGRGERPKKKEDSSVREFNISMSDEELSDLKGVYGILFANVHVLSHANIHGQFKQNRMGKAWTISPNKNTPGKTKQNKTKHRPSMVWLGVFPIIIIIIIIIIMGIYKAHVSTKRRLKPVDNIGRTEKQRCSQIYT